MYEVELKVRADHPVVRERLGALGATHRRSVRQVDAYFDAPHRDFGETDEALRLRRESDGAGETSVLTYKGPLVEAESKTREEHETAVADGDEARAIAEALGFTVAATVAKDREIYALDGYTVALDTVDGLGEFVEVETAVSADGPADGEGAADREGAVMVNEAATGDDTVERAREGAVAVLRRLHLDPDGQIRTSYLALLRADGP